MIFSTRMRVESKCLMSRRIAERFADRGRAKSANRNGEKGKRKSFLPSEGEGEASEKEEMENNEIKRQTQSGFVMKFLFIIMNTRLALG
jgi:hypothetical protein